MIDEREVAANVYLTGFENGVDGVYHGTYQAWVDRAYAAEISLAERHTKPNRETLED